MVIRDGITIVAQDLCILQIKYALFTECYFKYTPGHMTMMMMLCIVVINKL